MREWLIGVQLQSGSYLVLGDAFGSGLLDACRSRAGVDASFASGFSEQTMTYLGQPLLAIGEIPRPRPKSLLRTTVLTIRGKATAVV